MEIKELIINTKKLKEQLTFYNEVLEFELIERTKISASFRIGKSVLTFSKKKTAKPYHFAFNIPRNKENEALSWLKSRVKVLSFENYEIIDFPNWKAKAIYFYDRDHNIVEFIARREFEYDSIAEFGSKEVINISEVGIATYNIEKIYNVINSMRHINVFYGDFKRFCALGDDEGLFIVVDMLKKKWFPTGDKIQPSNFIIKGDYNFEYHNGKITINQKL